MFKKEEGFSREKLPGNLFGFRSGSGVAEKPDMFQIFVGIVCTVAILLGILDALFNSFAAIGIK